MLKPNDKIKDNDPRIPYNRVLRVVETDCRYAYCLPAWNDCRAKKTTHRILLNRIHTDGKPRRSGFSLIEDER